MLYEIGRIGHKEFIEILTYKHIIDLLVVKYIFQLKETLLIKLFHIFLIKKTW